MKIYSKLPFFGATHVFINLKMSLLLLMMLVMINTITRVLPGQRRPDYINASYIDGFQRSRAYIGTQVTLFGQ